MNVTTKLLEFLQDWVVSHVSKAFAVEGVANFHSLREIVAHAGSGWKLCEW